MQSQPEGTSYKERRQQAIAEGEAAVARAKLRYKNLVRVINFIGKTLAIVGAVMLIFLTIVPLVVGDGQEFQKQFAGWQVFIFGLGMLLSGWLVPKSEE